MAILPINGLEDYEVGTVTWPQIFNANMSFIDERLIVRGTFAGRPAAASIPADVMYYATDTNELYYHDGASWTLVTTTAPVTPPLIATETATFGTTAASVVLIPTMLLTVVSPGDYLVEFSSRMDFTNGSTIGQCELASGPSGGPYTNQPHTVRQAGNSGSQFSIHTQAIFSGLVATDEIVARGFRFSGGGTVQFHQRSIIGRKV